MLLSEYLKEFNRNVIINNNKILESGGYSGLENRKALIAKFTGTLQLDDITVGIVPETVIKDDLFVWKFRVQVVVENDGKLFVPFETTVEQDRSCAVIARLLNEVVQGDMDLDTVLKEYKFKRVS